MQGLDADHRAILSIADKDVSTSTHSATNSSARVLAPSAQWVALQTEKPSVLSTLLSFIVLGMEHIGSGADHIAFVICLVLGLALWRDWKALLTTVTAFTVGHSMTLIAATLGWVGSPGWVEPVIAFSIAVAAALNLIATRVAGAALAAWSHSLLLKAAVATGFGLVHGLGFSGAMTEAQVPQGALLWALAGFNIGVELGQLLIIAAWSVIYFALRKWAGYPRWIVQAGSVALMVLALYWFFERLGIFG
jgi:hypothetical protein